MIAKEDLDYLKLLDELRSEARVLRDKGLEGIVAYDSEDEVHWEHEISDNEKVLFRRAKHLAWNLGKIEEYDCERLDVQYFSEKSEKPQSRQKYGRRVNYPNWPAIVLPVLKKADITDRASLCTKIKDSTDPLSTYLRNQYHQHNQSKQPEQLNTPHRLNAGNQTIKLSDPLKNYKPSTTPSPVLVRKVLETLNSVLPDPSLQEYALKANVKLRKVTKTLLAKNPQGAELMRLNRMLMGDAYPEELTRGCQSIELAEIQGEVTETDITDRVGLCSKLKNEEDALTLYLREKFSKDTTDLLDEYTTSTAPSPLLIKALLRDLNSLLSDASLQTYALQANVKLTEVTRFVLADDPRGAKLIQLNRLLLGDAYYDEIRLGTQSVELFEMDDEPAPILFAANFLRTRLGNLHGCLDEGTASCYYRVVRELFNLHNTNWALGAARPGELSGQPSVFVTTECARAIGYFARLMENTSLFLKRMHQTKEYVRHVKSTQNPTDPSIPPLHPAWCESELNCCAASVKTTIEGYRDYVAILLPDLKDVSLDKVLHLVEKSVEYFADESAESFRTVIQWSKMLRDRERGKFTKWRRKLRKPNQKETLLQFPLLDLTETAHRVAYGALAATRQDFKRLQRTCREAQRNESLPGTAKVLEEASIVFGDLAKWLRTHLDPSKEYFEKNLHRCLAENSRGGSPNMIQDLALSALSLGLITKDWQRHDCRQAIAILCANLDERGLFPAGLPFAYSPNGEGRVVINAQIIRAFAQLAQHLTSNLNSEVKAGIPNIISRMLDYFKSQAIELERGIAWPSLRALNRERSSLWVSSISVLALHRIILMLDAHINHDVKKHFNTKTVSQLRQEGVPYLHELMCSDIGYVSLGNNSSNSKRVVMELEGMRAHLLGSGRAKKALRTLHDSPLRSLILYGPPGTGKTTLVKSLAVTSHVDLVEVMAHDLYGPGSEKVMEQASHVMEALKLLTSTAILFDEFEPILHSRPEHPQTISEMLTGNMLPKLDALYKSAGENGIAYILSTNYVERLDSAAIRVGRFDRMHFIYYADAASRACRLVSELSLLMNRREEAGVKEPIKKGSHRRLMEVVAMNARRYINHLCRTGWFLAPRAIKTTPVPAGGIDGSPEIYISPQTRNALSPVWDYVIENIPSKEIGWHLFGSAEKMIDGAALTSKTSHETDEEAIMKMVRDWDDELRNVVQYHPNASWQQMLNLLSKPIQTRKHSPESTNSQGSREVINQNQVPDRRSGQDRRWHTRRVSIPLHPYLGERRSGSERRA